MLDQDAPKHRYPISVREPIDKAGTIFVALLVAFGVTALAKDASTGNMLGWLIVAPGSVALIVLAWRFRRMCVRIGPSGLLVANLTKTSPVAWGEIRSVTIGDSNAWFWTGAPVLNLRAGGHVPMPAIQSPNSVTRPNNKFGDRAAEFLNALLDLSAIPDQEMSEEQIRAVAAKFDIPVSS